MPDKQIVHPGVARFLLGVNGVVWLTIAVIVLLGAHPSFPEASTLRWILAFGMVVTSGVLVGLSLALKKRGRYAFWLAVGLLGFLALATVLDEFGLADLAYLSITLLALFFLLKDRARYFQRTGETMQG